MIMALQLEGSRWEQMMVLRLPLLQEIDIKGSNILGDKAYGAKAIREYITSQGATYTISPRENCDTPMACRLEHL